MVANNTVKRQKLSTSTSTPLEISFDESARQTYLTGFHRRKVARIQHSKEVAAKREKEEKTRDRAELRKRRIEEVRAHVEAIEGQFRRHEAIENFGNESEDEEEWTGIEDPVHEPQRVDWEEEYVDEDKFTTVTVEEVGISKEGFVDLDVEEEEAEERREKASKAAQIGKEQNAPAKKSKKKEDKLIQQKKNRKKRSFRYESKVDREKARLKVKMRKNSLAAKRRKN